MPAVSGDAGAFAPPTSTSGCGARNAGAIVREYFESAAGGWPVRNWHSGQLSTECVKRSFLGDVLRLGNQIATLVQRTSAVSYPALFSVTASGRCRRPAAAGSSASITSPPRRDRVSGTPASIALRVTVSARNLVAKFSKDFSGASVNAELRPWEPGPSLSFAQV